MYYENLWNLEFQTRSKEVKIPENKVAKLAMIKKNPYRYFRSALKLNYF